jgi:hypothetical protein
MSKKNISVFKEQKIEDIGYLRSKAAVAVCITFQNENSPSSRKNSSPAV